VTLPLRKVVNRDLRHVSTSMSQRGRNLTITNHYHTVFTLECGHVIEIPKMSLPRVAAKRCKRCGGA
jgi:hypothetical protein